VLECHIRNCKYRGPSEEGPFCHQLTCINTLEVVKIWPDDTFREQGEDEQGLSDDYILACVNEDEDATVPSYDEAIRR